MKHTILFTALFLALAIQAGAQELRGVQLEIIVSNNAGREQLLTLGVYEGASSGLDYQLGESELPPQPPNEIFDARVISTPGASQLGTGSHSDFRPPSTTGDRFNLRYVISYQAGLNAQSVTLSWNSPYPGRITRMLIDDVDMAGKTELESQFATGQFLIELSFDMSPLSFSASPMPVAFNVNSVDPLPSVNLTITPQGDTQAHWQIDLDDLDWLDIEPTSGEGEETVTVSVNTRLLDSGKYDGVIKVRSSAYPARLDIPVTMTMTVGVDAYAASPSSLFMSQNYPNPFNPATVIEVDLGNVKNDGQPRLIVRDLLGRDVADLSADLRLLPGRQMVTFNASSLPGGVYTYTLQHGNDVVTRSMIVLK
jgi:hypothetical protein